MELNANKQRKTSQKTGQKTPENDPLFTLKWTFLKPVDQFPILAKVYVA
jgi:hypothetical protein